MYVASGNVHIHLCTSTTRKALARIRLKALRSSVWFSKLSRDERILIELVIRVTDRVRSFLLTKLLSRIVKKLLDALRGEVARMTRTVGRALAQKLSGIGQGWGNKSAKKWSKDSSFIRYITIMYLNDPTVCSKQILQEN